MENCNFCVVPCQITREKMIRCQCCSETGVPENIHDMVGEQVNGFREMADVEDVSSGQTDLSSCPLQRFGSYRNENTTLINY